jgi:sugar/nucleoside kinase (ribokinase family)
MQPGVAAIGLCSWDRFIVTDAYPGPGEYAIVRQQLEQAGGTTANTCAALATLGVPVQFASYVGDDDMGERLIASLRETGCDVRYVKQRPDGRSDTGVIVVSGGAAERDRTIYWIQGEKPLLGDWLPIDELLDHEWLLIDVDDVRLRDFLLDLPAHRSPRTRLVGTLTYLVETPAIGWQQALRYEYVCGNEREMRALTGAPTFDAAVERAQREMLGNACKAFYISRGSAGSVAIRPRAVTSAPAFPIDVIDTTGAGDAFAAGCLWGLVERSNDAAILARGNAAGGLVCRALGARTALGTRAEALELLAERYGEG